MTEDPEGTRRAKAAPPPQPIAGGAEPSEGSALLERSIEALFAAPPEAFVAERTRLVAELKRAGNKEGAAAIAKMQKPTLSAWAVNQLARREREAVRRLAEASGRVREAQLGMVSRGAEESRQAFAAASAAQREALGALRAAAERILAEGEHAVTPAVLERITQNLRAMVSGEEAVRQIEAGRLARDLPAEQLADFAALAAAIPAGGPKRAAGPPVASNPAALRRQAQEQADHEKEVSRRRRAAEQAEALAARAREATRRARQAADEADAEARRADAAADEARRHLEKILRAE